MSHLDSVRSDQHTLQGVASGVNALVVSTVSKWDPPNYKWAVVKVLHPTAINDHIRAVVQPVVVEVIGRSVCAPQVHCLAHMGPYASVTAIYGSTQAYKESDMLVVEVWWTLSVSGFKIQLFATSGGNS